MTPAQCDRPASTLRNLAHDSVAERALGVGATPADGISAAVALGYLGFLAGPPLIGAVAEVTNLTIGLALVAALAALVAS